MNYGAEPADQVVRYYLEGAEFALKLAGTGAKDFAVFAAAVLKDQKKTHGKTNLVRLLREQKPLKFFDIPAERMYEFAKEAKRHGLLYVPIRDNANPDMIEVAILEDDAAKVSRIIDRMQLDVVETGFAEAVDEVEQDRQAAEQVDGQDAAEKTETVETEVGEVEFAIGEDEELFNTGFTPAADTEPQPALDMEPPEREAPLDLGSANPSEPSSPSREPSPPPFAFHSGQQAKGERPSVRLELGEIRDALRARQKGDPQIPMPKTPIKIKRDGMVM